MAGKSKAKKQRFGSPWLGKRGQWHPRSKPIITPDGRFESLALAADYYRVTPGMIWQRVAYGHPGYRYAKPRR